MNATEGLYLAVRQREGRLYSDEVVALLPATENAHPHHAEWQARRASARRLAAYLRGRSQGLRILDLGCGNGWLAALARLPGVRVTGLDINGLELAQAARVFGKTDCATFPAADVFRPPFPAGNFDVVVMASAAQYFADLASLFGALRTLLLTDGGEIHLLDSPFYRDDEVQAARSRSAAYYEDLGFPEMSARYHHHTWRELNGTDFSLLYNPRTLQSKLRRRLGATDSPFPWVRVRFPA